MKLFDHSNDQLLFELLPNPKRTQHPNFESEIFGRSHELIKTFLKESGNLQDSSCVSLADQVKEFIYHKDDRRLYVDTALAYLKNKNLQHRKRYDVILIGAGIHAATYLYTLRKRNSAASVLIVEKTSTVSSTFAELGDSLVLNSPTYRQVDLNSNVIPGHFVQASDFDELQEKTFPTAKHIFELAVMVLLHSDADIVFDFEVNGIRKTDDGYSLNSEQGEFLAESVVIANGMGDPNKTSYINSQPAKNVIFGDDFIAKCYQDRNFIETTSGKTIAVIGDGDTANCVLEYILPTVYPNKLYGFHRENPALPKLVYWIGQRTTELREFFFNNKRRYGHSGGIIEVFWKGESPLELPTGLWKKSVALLRMVPDRLVSLAQQPDLIELNTTTESLEVDLVIDCTGRLNQLSSKLLQDGYKFVEGDILFYGGLWCPEQDRFTASPKMLKARRIACQLAGENVFFLGCACPLGELIDDEEAKNGAAKHQEGRLSLTNSKWSLEHTLPRSVAFAEKHVDWLTCHES